MRFRHFIFTILLLGGFLCAQTHPPVTKIAANSTRLSGIRVTGSTRFQSSELVSSSGLKIGGEGTDDALKAGAELLASSGMFTDVTYSWVSSPQGTRVEYRVQDVEKLYPAEFDNFVWLQRQELVRALQQRRPLFHGEVPNAGNMYIQLGEDLKAILAEKNIIARVRALPLAPQGGGSILGFMFTVEGVKIPIRTVDFPGVDAEMLPVLKGVASPKIGSDYTESGLRAFSRLDLLPEYQKRGYLRARMQPPEFVLVDAASNAVSVKLPVVEGLCYQLTSVEWFGNTAFSAKELANALKVQIGKAANQLQLQDDLGGIEKKYGTKGYMEARLNSLPTFDDVAKAVSFRVEVTEGAQYHFGSVRVEGATEAISKKFGELWKLRKGDVFDSSYALLFFQALGQQVDLSRLRVSIAGNKDKETKTVDVVFRFAPR